MVAADGLAPTWRQVICNHHDGIRLPEWYPNVMIIMKFLWYFPEVSWKLQKLQQDIQGNNLMINTSESTDKCVASILIDNNLTLIHIMA